MTISKHLPINTSRFTAILLKFLAVCAMLLCLTFPTKEAQAGFPEHTIKLGSAISTEDLVAFQAGYAVRHRWSYVTFGLDLTTDINALGEYDEENFRLGAALVTQFNLSIDPANFGIYAGPGIQFSDKMTVGFMLRAGVELTFRVPANVELGVYAAYDWGTDGDMSIHYGNFGVIIRFAKPN